MLILRTKATFATAGIFLLKMLLRLTGSLLIPNANGRHQYWNKFDLEIWRGDYELNKVGRKVICSKPLLYLQQRCITVFFKNIFRSWVNVGGDVEWPIAERAALLRTGEMLDTLRKDVATLSG